MNDCAKKNEGCNQIERLDFPAIEQFVEPVRHLIIVVITKRLGKFDLRLSRLG